MTNFLSTMLVALLCCVLTAHGQTSAPSSPPDAKPKPKQPDLAKPDVSSGSSGGTENAADPPKNQLPDLVPVSYTLYLPIGDIQVLREKFLASAGGSSFYHVNLTTSDMSDLLQNKVWPALTAEIFPHSVRPSFRPQRNFSTTTRAPICRP